MVSADVFSFLRLAFSLVHLLSVAYVVPSKYYRAWLVHLYLSVVAQESECAYTSVCHHKTNDFIRNLAFILAFMPYLIPGISCVFFFFFEDTETNF